MRPLSDFSGTKKKGQGSRENGAQRSPLAVSADACQRRAFAEIARFNTQKPNWDRFRVGGVDARTYKVRINADGTVAAGVDGISTAAIVASVVVIDEATKKDDPPASRRQPVFLLQARLVDQAAASDA